MLSIHTPVLLTQTGSEPVWTSHEVSRYSPGRNIMLLRLRTSAEEHKTKPTTSHSSLILLSYSSFSELLPPFSANVNENTLNPFPLSFIQDQKTPHWTSHPNSYSDLRFKSGGNTACHTTSISLWLFHCSYQRHF